MTWPEDPESENRIFYFNHVGVVDRLNILLNDENVDVKERAKTALSNLQGTNHRREDEITPMQDVTVSDIDNQLRG